MNGRPPADLVRLILDAWVKEHDEEYGAWGARAKAVADALATGRLLNADEERLLEDAVTRLVETLTYQRIYAHAPPRLPLEELPERCGQTQRIIDVFSPLLGAAAAASWRRSLERAKRFQFRWSHQDDFDFDVLATRECAEGGEWASLPRGRSVPLLLGPVAFKEGDPKVARRVELRIEPQRGEPVRVAIQEDEPLVARKLLVWAQVPGREPDLVHTIEDTQLWTLRWSERWGRGCSRNEPLVSIWAPAGRFLVYAARLASGVSVSVRTPVNQTPR